MGGGGSNGWSQAEKIRVERERDEANRARDEAIKKEQAAEQRAQSAMLAAHHRAEEQCREARQRASVAETLLIQTRADAERRIADERKNERDRIHAEEHEKWTALNREYPQPIFLEGYITKMLEDADANAQQQRFVNIGVLGNSGTGKSSLLKTVLGKFPVGPCLVQPTSCCEGDGTRLPTPYRLQDPQRVIHIWDLPGQGTQMFPSKTYLCDMGLKYFDFIVVTTDGRWTENDKALYDAIKFAGVELMVVRTKVDLAVDDCFNDHGIAQEEALAFTRASLAEQLPGLPCDRLHLVTTRPKFWKGAHGDIGFGSVDSICGQVAMSLNVGMSASLETHCVVSSNNETLRTITCESVGPSDSVSQVDAGVMVPNSQVLYFSLESNVSQVDAGGGDAQE